VLPEPFGNPPPAPHILAVTVVQFAGTVNEPEMVGVENVVFDCAQAVVLKLKPSLEAASVEVLYLAVTWTWYVVPAARPHDDGDTARLVVPKTEHWVVTSLEFLMTTSYDVAQVAAPKLTVGLSSELDNQLSATVSLVPVIPEIANAPSEQAALELELETAQSRWAAEVAKHSPA
jgi:hypothetical protein